MTYNEIGSIFLEFNKYNIKKKKCLYHGERKHFKQNN